MPQKLNRAGKMQDYIPAGNGDPSGEYGTSKGTNKNFTASDKKKTEANVITENVDVVWLKDKINETAKKKSQKEEDNSTLKVYGTEEERDKKGAEKMGVSLEEYKKLKEEHRKEMADIFDEEKYREYGKQPSSVKATKQRFNLKDGYTGDFYVVDKLPDGWRVDEGATTAPHGYVWVNNNKSLFGGERETAIMKRDALNESKANIINDDLTGKGNSIQEAYNLLNSDNIESIEYEMNWKNTSSGRDNLTFSKKLDDKNKFLNMLDATYGSKKQLEKNLAFSHQTNYLVLKVKEKGHRAKDVKLSYEDLIKLNNKITGKRTKQ